MTHIDQLLASPTAEMFLLAIHEDQDSNLQLNKIHNEIH